MKKASKVNLKIINLNKDDYKFASCSIIIKSASQCSQEFQVPQEDDSSIWGTPPLKEKTKYWKVLFPLEKICILYRKSI